MTIKIWGVHEAEQSNGRFVLSTRGKQFRRRSCLQYPPLATPICFARGTLIVMSYGEKLIETLQLGDMMRNVAEDLVKAGARPAWGQVQDATRALYGTESRMPDQTDRRFFGDWFSGDPKTTVPTIGTAAGQQGGSDAPISQNSPVMRRSASRQSGSRVCSFGACCEQPR